MVKTTAPVTQPTQVLPSSGGSYVRSADELHCNESTKPHEDGVATDPPAAAAPGDQAAPALTKE